MNDTTQPIQIPELSSRVYAQRPLSEFVNAIGNDSAQMFAVADLMVEGKAASRNLLYFVPTKNVHLPPPEISSELVADGSSYRLRLTSKALARSVYVSFANVDTQLSDNYIDLLPGEPVDISIHSNVGVEQLRQALRITSLADAFLPPGSAPTKREGTL